MEDATTDKRRARNAEEFIIIVKEFCNLEPPKESLRLLKAMLSRVTGGKEDFKSVEVTQLALGRDKLWKQTQVNIMRALQKAITLSRLHGKVFDLPWLTFVNKLVLGDVLETLNFLLQLHISEEVLEQDYFSGISDPWDSVHFYAMDILANIVISSYWENPGTKRFLKRMVTSGTFEKLLRSINDKSSDRFLTTCMAVYIASNVCLQVASLTKGGLGNKNVVRSQGILQKLSHFIYKENAIKMATEWFQNGVEQFEFDALAERPEGMSVMNTDGVFMLGCLEMSRKKTLQSAINWAISLQYHSIEYLAAVCNPEIGFEEDVMKNRVLCKSICRWLRSPIYHADLCLLVQSCLRVVSQIGDSANATWSFMTEKNIIKYLERGMYYPNARAVSSYLDVVTKLARHRGYPRSQIVQNEAICRAVVLNLYSLEEIVQVFALSFLHILVETDAEIFLRHFPPHEMALFKDFFFDKTESGLSISDLIANCTRFHKQEYDDRFAEAPIRPSFDIDKSSTLKDEGNYFFKNSNYREAISRYTQAIKFCPPTVKEKKDSKPKWNSLIVTLYCNRAQSYLKDNQDQEAVEDCDIAVARCLGAAERLKDFDSELFKKAVYRRSIALFNLKEYERAAIDIGECIILEQERKEFRAHMDKVVMMCRHKLGYEHIRKCIGCDGAKGLPLKKCPKCPALYCSRVCQLEAWENHHKGNCDWFQDEIRKESQKVDIGI